MQHDQHNTAMSDDDQLAIDQQWMRRALQLAERGAAMGEVPVGAVVVADGKVIGEGWNKPISSNDPSAHAEIVALREAATHIGNYRLVDATLYVTIEPCTMCAGALVHARLARLVYAATEPKAGVVDSQCQMLKQPYLNHQIDYCGGVLADESRRLMSDFFQRRRAIKKQSRQRL